jgi:perosamine synthetase
MLERENSLTELTYFRGRVAMYALLKALGVGQGDEVVLQAFTCLAVPEAIMALGAKPVYVDIETEGFNMSASELNRMLTPRVRAIVVQHTFGIPADMKGILAVAQRHGLPVVEDCCHTIQSSYGGKPVGSFGVGAFYSFEWGKPIVTGIGGAALVNEPSLLERVRREYASYQEPPSGNRLRLQLQYWAHGILYRPVLFWPVRSLYHKLGALGAAESNYNPVAEGNVAKDFSLRMAAELQLRLERKLTRLDRVTAHSREVTKRYKDGIHHAAIRHPALGAGVDAVFARYPLRVHDKPGVLKAARKANVELAEWYATPIHPLQPKDWRLVHYLAGSCPNVERRCAEVVTLPTHPAVARRDVVRTLRFLGTVRQTEK